MAKKKETEKLSYRIITFDRICTITVQNDVRTFKSVFNTNREKQLITDNVE